MLLLLKVKALAEFLGPANLLQGLNDEGRVDGPTSFALCSEKL